MDFFAAQDRAHRTSGRLLWLFVLAVVGVIVSLYLVISAGAVAIFGREAAAARSGYTVERGPEGVVQTVEFWDLSRFGWISALALIIIGGAALLRWLEFNAHGGAIARRLGGRRVDPTTRQPRERQLLNVVEEMALASGLPIPEVYILDHEPGINAFAAGPSPERAAVAVTAGALQHFTRDELQGVMAHEFSHILHGDVALNGRLGSLVYGILVLSIIGQMMLRASLRLRWHSGDSRSQGGQMGLVLLLGAIGLAFWLVGWVGSVFGHLLQAALSRQREFLADAAAVQFTRNPDGFAKALQRLLAHQQHGRVSTPEADGLAHLFFASALREDGGTDWWATHPPLRTRIRAILPNWDGQVRVSAANSPRSSRRDSEVLPADSGPPPAEVVAALGLTEAMQSPGVVVSRAEGQSSPLRTTALPPLVESALQDAALTPLLVLCLAAREHPQAAEAIVAEDIPSWLPAWQQLAPAAAALSIEQRLPVLERALAILRAGTPDEQRTFLRLVDRLLLADGHVSLFETVLRVLLRQRLLGHQPVAVETEVELRRADLLAGATAVVLSAVAQAHPATTPDRAAQAFRDGVLGTPWAALQLLPAESISATALFEALADLRRGAYGLRRTALQAAVRVARSDQQMVTEEYELLRALATSLQMPLPVLLPSATA